MWLHDFVWCETDYTLCMWPSPVYIHVHVHLIFYVFEDLDLLSLRPKVPPEVSVTLPYSDDCLPSRIPAYHWKEYTVIEYTQQSHIHNHLTNSWIIECVYGTPNSIHINKMNKVFVNLTWYVFLMFCRNTWPSFTNVRFGCSRSF